MSDAPQKPWYAQLPAKFAAVVVFLVAATTLVGNIFELIDKRKTADLPATSAAPSQPTRVDAPAPERVRLHLDRIVVEHDGSPGTTDWRFTVEVDGDPLFALQQEGLDEQAGRHVAIPEAAEGELRLGAARKKVVVKGWRGSWFKFGSEADAVGEGWLSSTGDPGVVRVQAQDRQSGAFLFHFSTTAVD